MSNSSLIDLSLLPKPQIIKTHDYEGSVSEIIARLMVSYDKHGVPFDVENLLTDPSIVQAEAYAWREMGLEARMNDVALANTLYFSEGTDLDHKASLYEIERMPGENDDRYRRRVQIAADGRGEERYKGYALEAHLEVEDVSVYAVDGGPDIEVAIVSSQNNGIPSQEILDAVQAKIAAKEVSGLNDRVKAVSAVRKEVIGEADVKLLPGATGIDATSLENLVKDKWNSSSVLGLDLTKSWLVATLHINGCYNVDVKSPQTDIIASHNEAIAITSFNVNIVGVAR